MTLTGPNRLSSPLVRYRRISSNIVHNPRRLNFRMADHLLGATWPQRDVAPAELLRFACCAGPTDR